MLAADGRSCTSKSNISEFLIPRELPLSKYLTGVISQLMKHKLLDSDWCDQSSNKTKYLTQTGVISQLMKHKVLDSDWCGQSSKETLNI